MPEPRIIEYKLAASENVTATAQKVERELGKLSRVAPGRGISGGIAGVAGGASQFKEALESGAKVAAVIEAANVGFAALNAGVSIFKNGLAGSREEMMGLFQSVRNVPGIGHVFQS